MSRLLAFDKLKNIRDLGGMRSMDGRTVRQGKLIRCGHLADLSRADEQKLSEMVDVIVDFRTDNECEEHPDNVPSSAVYIHLPVVDSLKPGITREEESDFDAVLRLADNPEGARQYMSGLYRDFADSDFALRQYAEFVRLLLEDHSRALLWHCSAGKDRAGIASVIVEELLGIPKEAIFRDYLQSNEYLKDDIVFITGYAKSLLKSDSPKIEESMQYLLSARQEYVEAYYERIEKNYGGFPVFLHDALHLSSQDIEALRQKYLVWPSDLADPE